MKKKLKWKANGKTEQQYNSHIRILLTLTQNDTRMKDETEAENERNMHDIHR